MTKSNYKYLGIFITFVFIICFTVIANVQAQEETPIPPESRQLEFFSGDWNIEWDLNNGRRVRGNNIAGYILEGRVFQENWNGRPGMDMAGKSWFVFDAKRKLWQQAWVNDQGEFSQFEGKFENGNLVMNALKNEISARGVAFEVRSIYRDIKDDSFKVEVQRRRVGTDQWGTTWIFNYKRSK